MNEKKTVFFDAAVPDPDNRSAADDALEYHPEDIDQLIAHMDGEAS